MTAPLHCRLARAALAAALPLLLAPGPAAADVISGRLAFDAGAFPAGAPVDPVTGVVEFSFDNSANIFGAADGAIANGEPVRVSVTGLSLSGAWTPVLTYVRSGMVGGSPVADLLAIGHAPFGTVVNAGTDDWRVAFSTASVTPTFREFTYADARFPDALFVTTTGRTAAVPEPASWALLAVGLALLVRRRMASSGNGC